MENDEKENSLDAGSGEEANDPLARCMSERQEYLQGWQRSKADFINYKNEEGRRLEDTARFVIRSFISDILPVLDSFELALQQMGGEQEGSQGAKGILLIRSQLLDTLKKRGVEIIGVQRGDPFNPELHEALGETESDLPEGTIAEEFQKGYKLQGKVVRPARVRLAK